MNRVIEHPILGPITDKRKVIVKVDGKPIEAFEGEPIAAALVAAGVRIHRFTEKRNEPRGLFCAIGRCTDCVMTVDGVPNIRTCITPVRKGMNIQTQHGLGHWK